MAASARRKELVEATIRVAVREGLDAATIRRVAQEAQVSLGTVHYCFDSKQALLEAVVESIEPPVVEADVPPGASVADIVDAGLKAYWRQDGVNRERQQLLLELSTSLARQGAEGRALAKRIVDGRISAVEQGLARYPGEVAAIGTTPHVLARLICALTDGVSLAWVVDGDDNAASSVFHQFAQVLGAAATGSEPPA